MGLIDRLKGFNTRGSEPAPPSARSKLEHELIHTLQGKLDGNDSVRYYLRFDGTVQGVGFRWTNQGTARDLHLTGWVKNLDDGSVEMELQGPPAAIIKHLDTVHSFYNRGNYQIMLVEEHEMAPRQDGGDFGVKF